MTPVSLLANMMETRHVLGRTAATTSSTSTRAVSFETDTKVTSVTETRRHRQRKQIVRKTIKKKTLIDPDQVPGNGLLPALPSFCRRSATSLTESCSTLEVMMWGRPSPPLWCLSPHSVAPQLRQKCSTAVWRTRLLAWKEDSVPWSPVACLALHLLCYWELYYLCSAWCEDDVLGSPSNHPRHVLSGLINHGFGFSTWR